MKFIRSLAIAAALCMTGCAVAQTPAAQTASAAGFDLSKLPLSKFAHADLQNAAAIAAANGFPARAAVWTAMDSQLKACEAAISAAVPKLPPAGSTTGAATLLELGAEGVGQGIPANVMLNCSAITLPRL